LIKEFIISEYIQLTSNEGVAVDFDSRKLFFKPMIISFISYKIEIKYISRKFENL
jgi:hypothetical protein